MTIEEIKKNIELFERSKETEERLFKELDALPSYKSSKRRSKAMAICAVSSSVAMYKGTVIRGIESYLENNKERLSNSEIGDYKHMSPKELLDFVEKLEAN